MIQNGPSIALVESNLEQWYQRADFYVCVMHLYPNFWDGCAQFLNFHHWIEYVWTFNYTEYIHALQQGLNK